MNISGFWLPLEYYQEKISTLCFFLQGKWLPTLRNLVVKINETFSYNFQEMAVAGEVSLGLLDGN